jgi:hypothetical protein
MSSILMTADGDTIETRKVDEYPSGNGDVDPDIEETSFFVENGGQWSEEILFASITDFGHVAFGNDFIIYNIVESHRKANGSEMSFQSSQMLMGTVIRIDLVESNGRGPCGTNIKDYPTNILMGKDPAGWGKNLRSYERIVFKDLWDGIDLEYYRKDGCLKYEYIISPGANPEKISFEPKGIVKAMIDGGELNLITSNGNSLKDGGLVTYHREDCQKPLYSSFEIRSDGTIGFRIEGRDPEKELVIDPVVYSTYIGGSFEELYCDMVMDGSGYCYITGPTSSFDFPTTPGSYSTTLTDFEDGIVMKIKPDGSSPSYSTYIGGSGWDNICTIDIDESGNAFIAGYSDSVDFPTTRGAFNETKNESHPDIVFSKLDSTGSSLLYSTYIGGNGTDIISGKGTIKVDDSGRAHILGGSCSHKFPVTDDAFDKENTVVGGGDEERFRCTQKMVLICLDPVRNDLVYSTFLGGSLWEDGFALDIQGGYDFIAGTTESDDYPVTSGAFDTSINSFRDICVTKFDISSSSLIYSTYVGGTGFHSCNDIEVDDSGRAFIIGETNSNDFPVTDDAYSETMYGFSDIYLTALDSSGSSLYFSTFLGGAYHEWARGIFIRPDGSLLVTGSTNSDDFPSTVSHKTDTTETDWDMFVVLFDPENQELPYSTIIGGSAGRFGNPEDVGQVIYHLEDRRVVVSGYSQSTDFPMTTDSWDNQMDGGSDLFLLNLDLSTQPGQPRNYSLEQGDGYLNLSWDEPLFDGGMNLLGFRIYKGEEPDNLLPMDVLVEDGFLNDTDLVIGTRYYYSVRAENPIGEGKSTEILNSLAVSSPTPPQFFQVFKGNEWVRMSWEPPVSDGYFEIQGYRIYKSSNTNGSEIIEVYAGRDQYLDNEVLNGVPYRYAITAYNRIGESQSSKEVSVMPQGEPMAPSNVTISNGTTGIFLKWDPPEDIGGSPILFYKVAIGIEREGILHWRYINTPTSEYVDNLVEIGNTYHYRVSAVNSIGESSQTETKSGTCLSEPTEPHSLMITEGDSNIILSWLEPDSSGGTDILGYHLFRSSEGNDFEFIKELDHGTQFFKDTGLTNGIVYTYRVSAFNIHGNSTLSDPVDGTPSDIPDGPLDPVAIQGTGFIELIWNLSENNGGSPVTEHQIWRGESGKDMIRIGRVWPGNKTFMDPDVIPGVSYSYRIRSRNRMGLSDSDDSIEVVALGLPGSPVDVSFEHEDGKILISWKDPLSNGGSPIIGYRICRKKSDNTDLIALGEVDSGILNFEDETVSNGTYYQYSISTLTGIGESKTVWSESVKSKGIPGSPRSLNIDIDGIIVLIQWSPPLEDGGSEVLLFRIYRIHEGEEPVMIGVAESTARSFIDDEEKESGEYRYIVVSVNEIGESDRTTSSDIELKKRDVEEDGFLKENIGLLITIPLILVLLVVVILMQVGRKRQGNAQVPSSFIGVNDSVTDDGEMLYAEDGFSNEVSGGVSEIAQYEPRYEERQY